jgi:hypothetical protein
MCFSKLFKNNRKVYPLTESGSKYELLDIPFAWKKLPDGLIIVHPLSKKTY